ncbi:hypothetical protein ACKRZS_005677 [Fusarium odoratissimum]
MAGLQPDIYAAISITWAAASLALGLRLKARRMTKMNLWFDDYFAIIALLFVSGYCSVTIYSTNSASPSSRSKTPLKQAVFKTGRDFYSGSASFSMPHRLPFASSVFYASTGASFSTPQFDTPS